MVTRRTNQSRLYVEIHKMIHGLSSVKVDFLEVDYDSRTRGRVLSNTNIRLHFFTEKVIYWQKSEKFSSLCIIGQ